MAEQFLQSLTVTLKQYMSLDTGQYMIPFSQRPYEWTEVQVERLFRDLTSLGLPGAYETKHVLNFFTFSNEEEKLKLFDGQQRTVTTLMIYAEGLRLSVERGELNVKFASKKYQNYISDEDENGTVTPKVVFDKGEVTDEFYKLIDFENDYLVKEHEGLDLSIRSFIRNRLKIQQLWREIVSDDPDVVVKEILSRFLESTYLIEIIATTEEVAQRMFETLNNTGKTLESYYVLKNDLVSKLGESVVREKWNKLDDLLGDLDRRTFLSTVATLFAGKIDKQNVLESIYTSYEGGISIGLLDALLEIAVAYDKAINPNQMEISNVIERDEYNYTIDSLRDVFGLKQQTPMLTAMILSNYSTSDEIAVLKKVKSLAVRLLFFKEGRANSFENPLAEMAHAVYEDKIPVKEIFNKLQEGGLNISDDSLRSVIVDREITTPSARKKAKFVFKELYNQELAKNQSETMLPNNLQKIHYEHILPEKPKSGSEWMKDFPDDTTREHLTKTLGNATLLIGSKNEKLGNKEFSDKREIYKTSSLIENRRLAENKRWTAKEIKKRSVLLAEQFVKLYK
ncbi:DUF262 domain-containing protein [Weissella confusa]|uniref:DUF262 domain-containing protein n=1 Tax=Weissella confusa TaxID=1583 RepID=UPI000704DB53|nr:DUF1524 domain-containing protein [Weissella confusa]KRN23421.1 hypothetical protein IV69_GL001397 [Weissella confusa]MBJ7629053.1 DUF262 domain-containing protein [Weissella confusa]MBJ7699184.1 DUF262 domain-containing protein [Weissella confusa]MBS7551007.1 DUF262 domain-containing protein [Weissella confusa]MCQ8096918.1 DUF262 domain-containing HNH endonuclease family protein [Weissella confusa]